MLMQMFLGICFGVMIAAVVAEVKDTDNMRHAWIIEHMNCRETDETRRLLGETEVRWTCEKQDAFWRPITE